MVVPLAGMLTCYQCHQEFGIPPGQPGMTAGLRCGHCGAPNQYTYPATNAQLTSGPNKIFPLEVDDTQIAQKKKKTQIPELGWTEEALKASIDDWAKEPRMYGNHSHCLSNFFRLFLNKHPLNSC